MKKNRAGNRERIVESAITLMNARGGGIGTSQIADHLQISPGNLYYHFANREEIVREVLGRLRLELAETLALSEDREVSVARLVTYYSDGALVLWRYRFVVANALELIARDPPLGRAYGEFSIEAIEAIRSIISQVTKQTPGPMKANAKDCGRLAENMWVLWNGWPRHAELYRVQGQVNQAAIAHGLEQIALTLAPYLAPGFNLRVRRGLRRFVERLEQGL